MLFIARDLSLFPAVTFLGLKILGQMFKNFCYCNSFPPKEQIGQTNTVKDIEAANKNGLLGVMAVPLS